MSRTIFGILLLTAVLAWSPMLTNATTPAPQAATTQISEGPTVENISDTSAEVKWKTNVQSSAVVRYGTDPNNLDKTEQDPWGGPDHKVTLRNLQPNTRYHVRVESAQGQGTGTGAISALTSFMTTSGQGAAAGTSPIGDDVQITAGPEVRNLTANSATLWWRTNNVAASDVKYGTDPNNLDKRAYEPGGSREHSAELRDLEAGRTYHYQILTRNGQVRKSGSFQVPGRGAQASAAAGKQTVRITNGPVVERVGDNTAVIAWSTNVKSSSVVRYGESLTGLNRTADAPWGDTTHRVTITGLKPNTRYFFRVESAQAQGTGTQTMSRTSSFETVAPGAEAVQR